MITKIGYFTESVQILHFNLSYYILSITIKLDQIILINNFLTNQKYEIDACI